MKKQILTFFIILVLAFASTSCYQSPMIIPGGIPSQPTGPSSANTASTKEELNSLLAAGVKQIIINDTISLDVSDEIEISAGVTLYGSEGTEFEIKSSTGGSSSLLMTTAEETQDPENCIFRINGAGAVFNNIEIEDRSGTSGQLILVNADSFEFNNGSITGTAGKGIAISADAKGTVITGATLTGYENPIYSKSANITIANCEYENSIVLETVSAETNISGCTVAEGKTAAKIEITATDAASEILESINNANSGISEITVNGESYKLLPAAIDAIKALDGDKFKDEMQSAGNAMMKAVSEKLPAGINDLLSILGDSGKMDNLMEYAIGSSGNGLSTSVANQNVTTNPSYFNILAEAPSGYNAILNDNSGYTVSGKVNFYFEGVFSGQSFVSEKCTISSDELTVTYTDPETNKATSYGIKFRGIEFDTKLNINLIMSEDSSSLTFGIEKNLSPSASNNADLEINGVAVDYASIIKQ